MKDIRYFLDAEQEYIKLHSKDDRYFGDFEENSNPEDFLLLEEFSKIYKNLLQKKYAFDQLEKFNLSEAEYVMLCCFLGRLSGYFRDDVYEQYGYVPEIVKEMQSVLNSLIQKAPKHQGGIVYRFLNCNDRRNLSTGDILLHPCSLTTTTEDWEQNEDCYVITPLPEDKTAAYDLYKIYNHGNETQVNFLKGTKFEVTNVEMNCKKSKLRIYLKELEK